MPSIPLIRDVDVIGIDDGQFFPDLEEFCITAVDEMYKIVIVSALDSDYNRDPFENVCRLVSKAEFVNKISSICTCCGQKATFNFKFPDTRNDEDGVIDIGGPEKYTAFCRQCYLLKSELKSEMKSELKPEI
jgi:thymidine kinase